MKITIRRAGALESRVLNRIARAAGGCRNCGGTSEDGKSFVISPQFVFWNDVFAAEIDEKVVGFCALLIDGGEARLEHLCVDPRFQGFGVEQKLIDQAARHCKTRPAVLFDFHYAGETSCGDS